MILVDSIKILTEKFNLDEKIELQHPSALGCNNQHGFLLEFNLSSKNFVTYVVASQLSSIAALPRSFKEALTESQGLCPVLGMLEIPPHFHCLLHTTMCSAICNESVIQYNPEKRCYEKIGESTEVALRVLAEKIGLPSFDYMPSALNMLYKHERASYCNRYWENQFKKVSSHQ
ncbi:hypothetical protein ACS0TY_012311 [Phlomoides rotata]